MKIRRATVLLFSRKLDGTAWNPEFRWTERRAPILVIETDRGVVGLGEAWSRYKDVDSVLEVLVKAVAPALVGREVSQPGGFADSLRREVHMRAEPWALAAAFSAADIALWDACAKELGQPVWRLLGGSRPSAKVYASGGLYRDDQSLDELQQEARTYRDRGFDAMKIKVAGLPRQADLERVAAVRAGLGADARLWVDAVGQLSVESAIEFWRQLTSFGVCAMQSPLSPDDIDGMRTLNMHALPVIAGEAEHDHVKFRALLNSGAVTFLQYCLPLCGGFTGGMQLDDLAQSAGVRSTPQCFSTAIAQAATLHFAAARENVDTAEWHCFHDHLAALYEPGVAVIQAGRAALNDAPGLGVRVPRIGAQEDGSHVAELARVAQ